MESHEDYLSRAMGQFKGVSKRHGKIVSPIKKVTEWDEQIRFCKELKRLYPDVLFRSDIQSAGKLSPGMQNIKLIIDPYSAFPDITIYEPVPGYVGCMIEMKRLNSGTFLKDGSLSTTDHIQEQAAMHDRLRSIGWHVSFAEGAEQAMAVFVNYYKARNPAAQK